jgi:hypothetical protein
MNSRHSICHPLKVDSYRSRSRLPGLDANLLVRGRPLLAFAAKAKTAACPQLEKAEAASLLFNSSESC